MSPSWRERILIGFAPERLSAIRLTGWRHPRLVDRHSTPLAEPHPGEWERGMAALEALLADSAWRGRQITVMLSAHYVRHAVIPPARGLAETERLALARLVFRDIFGELANDWELRISPARADKPALACGVPRALLATLRTVCTAGGRLRSVRPGLMPLFNQVRRKIGRAAGHLALVEAGRVTLAVVEDEQWRHVDSRAGEGNILPELLLEEGQMHERMPGGILWLCDLTGTVSEPEDALWSSRCIKPPPLEGFDDASSLAIWGLS